MAKRPAISLVLQQWLYYKGMYFSISGSGYHILNWFNIYFQVTLLIRSFFASFTFKSFFPSWTDATTCFFKSPFLDNLWLQTSHLSGLFPLWTDATKVTLWRKSVLTNFTFHWLVYFMNCCYMLIQSKSFKNRCSQSQLSHFNFFMNWEILFLCSYLIQKCVYYWYIW